MRHTRHLAPIAALLTLLAATACTASDRPGPTAEQPSGEHGAALVTAAPDRLVLQFQGFHLRQGASGAVRRQDRRWYTPDESSRALTPCPDPTRFPADEERTVFAWDVFRDAEEVVLRQLAVYPDVATARRFLAEFVAASLRAAEDGPALGTCRTFAGRGVTGRFARALTPGDLVGVTPMYSGDEVHGVMERWDTGRGQSAAAWSVLIRQDNAVLLYRVVDEVHSPDSKVGWERAVTRAGLDARLLCTFDAARPCKRAPALTGMTTRAAEEPPRPSTGP